MSSFQDEILERIPQKPPFLYIQRIVDRSEDKIVTENSFTGEEEFFKGHFPGSPILPGVIQCEAVFQTGALLMSYQGHQTQDNQVAMVTRIQNAKFKRPVAPPATIEIEVSLTEMLGAAAYMKGKIIQSGKTIMTLDFACTITEK